MKYHVLNQRHPSVDLDTLADYDALYKGGLDVARRLNRLLPQRPEEPNDVYEFRKKVHHYLNYAGPIISFLASALASGRLEMRTKTGPVPDFYNGLKEDCDQAGTDLSQLIRDRLTQSLVKKISWVLVDFPRGEYIPENAAEWEAQGLGDGYLCSIDAECVLDWGCDKNGNLNWAIVHSKDSPRHSPGMSRDLVTESWTIYEPFSWARYAITYKQDCPPAKDADIPLVESGPCPTPGFVPLVPFELPHGLWAMNLLASPQLESFRTRNGLSWSLQRTCHAMRIFKLHEQYDSKPPTQGPGYGLVIGHDEDVAWDAPPMEAFSPVAQYADNLVQELHRVTHTMALGVDNSKASSVGRSGESKEADNSATDTVLKALGLLVCEFVERIFTLLSVGRGEKIAWHISGLNAFDTKDVSQYLDNSIKAQTLAIPSVTFHREFKTRAALAMVPDASQDVRDAIVKEINEGIVDESFVSADGKRDKKTNDDDDEDDKEDDGNEQDTEQEDES